MRSEGYGTWSVCVCLSAAILELQGSRWPMSDTVGFRTTQAWKIKRRFSSNDCVQEICRENKRKKPVCTITLGLLRPNLLALCTLEAQEVTTNGVYRLPQVCIAYALSPVHGWRFSYPVWEFDNYCFYWHWNCSQSSKLCTNTIHACL